MLLLPQDNARLGRRVQRIAYAVVVVLILLLKPVLFAESWGTTPPQTSRSLDSICRRHHHRRRVTMMHPLRGASDDANMDVAASTTTEKAATNRLISRRRALLDTSTALSSSSCTFALMPTAAAAATAAVAPASSEAISTTPLETSSALDTSTTVIPPPSNGIVPSRSSSLQSRRPPRVLPTINMLPSNSLAVRLAQCDPSLLSNRIFNAAPPSRQVYPAWLHGEWHIVSTFAGFVLVSRKISKERIVQDVNVPGFTKCSIAATADIGKEKVAYHWRIDKSGVEDRRYNFQQAIDAYLGYPAVRNVIYDGSNANFGGNPNRIGIDFVSYRTTNAERIELFANARESCEYRIDNPDDNRSKDGATTSMSKRVFCCAEYLRQVTFGTGSTVGVPRQAVTNYAHYWTYTNNGNTDGEDNTDSDSINSWTGNLLTAAYLDPNDAMYFDEPTMPVVMYSHRLVATRV